MKNKKSEINSKTELYCIFGKPVKHSLSPAMQNCAFSNAGLNAVYLAFEIDDIKEGIIAMKSLNIRGASVTIPHKREAIEHLDEIDPLAADIGSVNTLHNINGRIKGSNTDGYGALDALKNNNIEIKDKRALVIGNGGSARAIAFTLLKEGAHVVIAGRSRERVLNLVDDIKGKGKDIDDTLLNDLSPGFMENIDIIINTTPIGMAPDTSAIPVKEELIHSKHAVFDIVYSPDMTELLKVSKKKGCRIVKGIEMLVCQGAKQFEIWTGKPAPVSLMEKAAKKHMNK